MLDALGLTEAGQAGLAALPLADRAAFIAEAIEGFGSLDVITIAGIGGGRLAQRRAHARRAFAMAAAGPAAEDAGDEPTAEDAGDEPTTLGALAVVDVGRASEPPIRVPSTADEQDDVASPMHAGRAALSLAAVTVIASGAIVGAWRLWPAGEPPERPTPQRNIGEGVLGGAGGGTADPGPKSGFLAGSPSPTTTAAPSPSPDGTADSPGQPQPPPPAPPLPPPPGPTPTPAATPTAQPTPTASPTAQPSPSPTASPEPSPIPTVPISPPMP